MRSDVHELPLHVPLENKFCAIVLGPVPCREASASCTSIGIAYEIEIHLNAVYCGRGIPAVWQGAR